MLRGNCIEREGKGSERGREREKAECAGTPRANHSRRSANNLLVFHVRFDSLSFRYLYLSDLLRILGICAGNERNAGKNAAASDADAMSILFPRLYRFSVKTCRNRS